jgi:hypothetical protein
MFLNKETGEYRKLDIIAVDKNGNGIFDLLQDDLYAGYYYVRNGKDTYSSARREYDFRYQY